MESRHERLWMRLKGGNLLRRLVEEHFDGVLLIECATGEIWELGEAFSAKLRVEDKSMDGTLYDRQLREAMACHVEAADRDMLVRRLCLAAVKEALEQSEAYTVDVDTWHGGDDRRACKRFRFHYLDEGRTTIAMTCEDVTVHLLSETDPLTGMMNSVGFHRRVQSWVDKHPGRRYRIQRYNVDRFRDINGLYGREVGDRLLRDLETAVANEEFEVWFQPQVDYARRELVGAEALVRWRHPTRGLLMPGVFVPLLEKSDNIHQLDRYVIRKTCAYIHRWREAMPGRHITVSVNLSREDLDRPDLCAKLDAIMSRYAVPREALHLEVTESAYVEETQRVMQAVQDFRSRGFIVEMDDFGSGYSSLNALKDIDIDKLKLDMRFLAGDDTAKGRTILRYVIGMARALDLSIIAEGVETKEQADMLLDFGCSEMQGYYFSKPVPADAYERLLRGTDRLPALDEQNM